MVSHESESTDEEVSLDGHTIGFRQHMNDKLERFRVTFTANGKREIHVEKFSKEMSS